MLEQPGCPNLYWALTNLPNPLVPLDKGMEGERVGIVQWMFRDLDDSAPMSADQLKRFIAHHGQVARDGKPARPEGRCGLAGCADQGREAWSCAARRRLVEHGGLPEERLLRFPADQVILLDEKREFEVRFDDIMKTHELARLAGRALAGQITGRPRAGAVRR